MLVKTYTGFDWLDENDAVHGLICWRRLLGDARLYGEDCREEEGVFGDSQNDVSAEI